MTICFDCKCKNNDKFFDDKFFSIVSLWLQRFLFAIVLVKMSVLVERKNQKNASNL